MTGVALGVDVGGTFVKGSAVDPSSGSLVSATVRSPTPEPARIDEVIEIVAEVVQAVVGRDPERKVAPLGVALSGDVRDGLRTSGVNLHGSWVGAPARDLLQQRLGRSVTILNDADAAGIAEARFGDARGVAGVVVMLTFGTGIGSAVLIDGRLLPNTGFGQLPVRGGPAELTLSAVARERRGTSWHDWATEVSSYLAQVDQLLRPALIIIGGGVIESAASFWDRLECACELRPAKLRNEAGIIGAAVVAADSVRMFGSDASAKRSDG